MKRKTEIPDLDIDLGLDNPEETDLRIACVRTITQHEYRRAWSESKLAEVLEHNLQPGATYNLLTAGDVDSLSLLKHIVKAQPLDYCLFSTWCMATEDVRQFETWLASGRIKRVDAYCGEIFPGSYSKEHKALKEAIAPHGGRVAIFRNHAKIFAGIGPDYAFGIQSSSNINTNPRTENHSITVNREIFDFYKTFFDGVRSYTKDFPDWQPWQTS